MAARFWTALVSAAVLAAALQGCGGSSRASEADIAAQIKGELQRQLNETNAAVLVGKVTCQLNANGETATCLAQASAPADRAKGTYFIHARMGEDDRFIWRVTSETCQDADTGNAVPC